MNILIKNYWEEIQIEQEYIIKPDAQEIVHEWGINRKIAKKLGVTEGYISQIINGRKTKISKLMAFAFCNAINNDFEIEDIFITKN